MRQPHADMSIEQPQAVMNMTTTKGRLTIDQTEAWEEMNLMSTQRSIEKNAQLSRQLLHEGVTRRAEQGAKLLDIHLSDPTIAEQEHENQFPPLKTQIIK